MLAITEFTADAQQLQGELGGLSLDELERRPFVSVSASYAQLDAGYEELNEPPTGSIDREVE